MHLVRSVNCAATAYRQKRFVSENLYCEMCAHCSPRTKRKIALILVCFHILILASSPLSVSVFKAISINHYHFCGSSTAALARCVCPVILIKKIFINCKFKMTREHPRLPGSLRRSNAVSRKSSTYPLTVAESS